MNDHGLTEAGSDNARAHGPSPIPATSAPESPATPPVSPPGELQGIPVKPVQTTTVAPSEAPVKPLSTIDVPPTPAPAPQPPSPAAPAAPVRVPNLPPLHAPLPREEVVQPPKLPGMPPLVRPSGKDWEIDLEQASASAGVDPNLMRRMVGPESGGDPTARNPLSSAGGIFQITGPTWDGLVARYGARLGLTNRMDPKQQARVAPFYMAEINANLERVLKRKPNGAESYLGWFLGGAGAASILQANPETPVERIVSADALASNPKVFGQARTAGALVGWAGKLMKEEVAHPGANIDLSPYLAQGKDKSHLDGMGFDLKSRLHNMINDMPAELRAQIKINSGYRSPERQAEIFAEAVKKYGSEEAARKWAAPPGKSQHNHGAAADLGYGSEAVKQWIHANAAKYGLGFPMGHEPWHIEALGAREAKYARQGVTLDPNSGSTRIPFTGADDAAAHKARESRQMGYIEALKSSVSQDWMISNMMRDQGKSVYEPGFSVTAESLKNDPRVKDLPPNYLGYIGKSMSPSDYEFRVTSSKRDYDIEQRLSEYPLTRMAVSMADPAGIALSVLSPFGAAGKAGQLGRLGMLGMTAADGALGNLIADAPAMLTQPGYDAERAIWAGAVGAAGYVGLNREWARTAPHVAQDVSLGIKKTQEIAAQIESGQFGAATAGAAQNLYREAVRGDIEDFMKLETEKSGRAWMDPFRFDFAKMKNSENPVVAALADRLGLDTVGNRNKDAAVTRPIEHDKRIMEERANILWSRQYYAAVEDFKKRNGFEGATGEFRWKNGGEDEFQRSITSAVRNPDPLAEVDPSVSRMATVWQQLAAHWRERARNPGMDKGETMRPLPGAESWSDDPTYVPRFVHWERWNEMNSNFGTQQMRTLLGKAIAAQNPDMDPDLALKLGGWYYDRVRRVEAGQEMTGQKVFSGLDTEMMRKSLIEELGLSEEEVGRVLYQATAKDSQKGMTSRQKMRTHMSENFSMPMTGRDGVTRNVSVAEIWEDNMRAIVHAYNNQMSGAVALGQLRIENPRFKTLKDPTPEDRYLVDGIHSDGDWDKLMAQARAVDDQVRYSDRRRTVEKEINNLQWMYNTLTGKPHDLDRTDLGQVLRIAQKLNFVRLMSQAGFASVAELGMITGQVGWKHALKAMPHLEDLKRDISTGMLKRDVLEDFEYAFAVGTDHLRGTGMTFQGTNVATGQQATNMSRRLDKVEKALDLASRATSMVSLAPITTIEERLAQRAVLSKFRAAALGDETLNAQRMRLIGLDEKMQGRVLEQLKKHGGTVKENGRKIETLGLSKWDDEQARSAFEFAVNTWVRRIIQQNDLGQMNALLGSPWARLFTQFRSFMLGAWSKNTLSNIHMADFESFAAFMASTVFGGVAYMTQTGLNSVGLTGDDLQKVMDERLNPTKVAAASFQRAGFTSLMPGIVDLGLGVLGLDPLFDTRATQQPTQGWMANPTTGLIDGALKSVGAINKSVLQGEPFTRDDFIRTSSALNVFHRFPIMIQAVNATSHAYPEP